MPTIFSIIFNIYNQQQKLLFFLKKNKIQKSKKSQYRMMMPEVSDWFSHGWHIFETKNSALKTGNLKLSGILQFELKRSDLSKVKTSFML